MNIIYLAKHLPRLQKTDKDPAKVWTIVYYLQVEGTDEYVRQRQQISPTDKNKDNLKERLREANEVMYNIKTKMKNGYRIRREPTEPTPTKSTYPTLQEVVTQHLEKRTERDLKVILKAVAGHAKKQNLTKPVDELKLADFKAFFDGMGDIKPRTYNIYRSVMIMALADYKMTAEAEQLKLKKVTDSDAHQPFSDKERKSILETALEMDMPQLYLMCQFIFYTFARPHRELRDLRVGDIKEKTIFFKGSTAKNRKSYSLPIMPSLEKIIQEYKLREYPENYYIFGGEKTPTADRKLVSDIFYSMHLKVLKKLEFTEARHTLYAHKHSGVIALAKRAKNLSQLRAIQMMCRHASIQQTEVYLRKMGVNLAIDDDFLM